MKKLFLLMLTLLTLGFAAQRVSAQTVWDGTADISWYDASQTSFDISTPEQLAGVAALMTAQTTNFSGKTLNLTADIWLNADNDSTNNWIPIGGYASASSEDTYSTSAYAFAGTFKGNGHYIYNLYCDKSNYYQAGLFGCVQYPCTIDSLVMVNPIVKARGMSGSLIGYTLNSGSVYVTSCLIINCRVEATGNNNNGGLLGANWKMQDGSNWTYLTNCGVTGHVYGKYIGGVVGNGQKINATNVYFAGTLTPVPDSGTDKYGGILGHADASKHSFTHAYSNISSTYSSGRDGIVLTLSEMQTSDFIDSLGTGFMMDNGENNGYPVLSCMAGINASATEICSGESVTLTGMGYDSYSWTPGGATSQSITVSPTTTTTYTMTGSSFNGNTGTHTVTITVYPQAVVTAEVVASADGQTHATLNQSTFTVGCGSSDNINLVVTPETNWRVSRVTLNGNEIYGDTFGEGVATVTINPGGTLGEVKVFLSNEYKISVLELQDTGDTLHVSSLVQPYGSNGLVTVTAGSNQSFTFNNTARYALTDVTIDGASQGVVSTYDFLDIHENHDVVVTYVDSCGISGLPFVEGFEGPTNVVPECYERMTDNSYPYTYNYNAHSGSNSMYCYMYSTSTDYLLIFPKVLDTITYPMNELMVTFWARTSNTSNSYTVGVMSDPTNASTFTAVQTFSPSATNLYEFFTAYIGNAGYGKPYIAIKFDCGSTYTSTYIDDITVDFAPLCSPVTNLSTTSVYGSNATLTWNPTTVGEVSEYNIVVYDLTNETEASYTTTETTYLVTGLSELTSYQIGVFTSCTNGQSSDTSFVSFMTPCNNPVNYSVGNSTATNSYLPTYIYYGNTYSQQIVTADVFEGLANDFASISVKDNSTSLTTRACDIYLAHVPAGTTLSSGWILPSSSNVTFSLVFSGNVQFGTNDWVKIDFDTVFPYNGTDNLLVVFDDHTNSYTTSHNFDVVSNNNTTSMARYAYRDNTPYNVLNPGVDGTLLNVVNTFRFSYCDASSCISPNTLAASNVTENSADLTWVSAGSESSWEVEYKASTDAGWTSAGSISSTMTTLSGLDPNTLYTVHVRALCSGNETSPWSESISFRTECGPIAQLPYSEDFEDATAIYSTSQDNYIVCWDRYASNPSHYVYIPSNSYAHSGTHFLDFHHTSNCFNIAILPAVDASISISDLMISFYACRSGSTGYLEVGVMTDKTDPTSFVVIDTIDLSSYNTYEYGLQQVSFENYMDNGQYVAFRVSNGVSCGFYVDDVILEERPNCMYPTNLHVTNVSNDNLTLAWTETGSATAWNLLYGLTGFDPETEGTTVYADANPFTVTGLQNATSYDFYVQADCGGLQSQWTGPITVKTGVYNIGVTGSDTLTTCGVYLYDDGGENGNYSLNCNYTLVVYPETAGSGLSISGTVNTYSSYSYYNGTLTIYGGVGTSGTVLGSYTGTHNVSLAYGGPVTITFTTGSYYNYPGFELLVQCTECFPPTNLAVSNQQLDGATVTWSGNASEYAVYLSGAMTGYYTTTDTTYTFTGLSSSSSYNVQVRALCGSDSSLLSPTAHFNTACGAITITADNPWFEDFEGYSGGGAQSFVCWETPVTEVVDNGTSPFVYCGHSPSCHSGANSAELKGTNNMVVLPEFSNDIQDLRLSFWATTTSTSNYGTVEIGYITDINDPTTFVALGPAGVPGPRGSSGSGHGNFMGPFDFNGVTATSARMAIKFTGYSGLSWNLDDFTVSLAPNCPSPVKTSVQASNIDGHNATITFTDNDPSHNSWTVYYKPTADSVWNQEVTNTTTVNLTNLDPQTAYDVYVVTNCATPDQVEDATLTIHFTTTVACPAPTGVAVSNIGMNSATVTWNSTASSFTIEYGETGFTVGTGTSVTSTSTTYDLTGLTAGTSYTVYVTADCGVDGNSTSASANFNTALCDVVDQCEYTFNLTDSYGDGWNGASITIKQNGITVATATIPSGNSSNTVTVALCDGQSTTLIWNSGSYDSECSFEVLDANENVVYTASTVSAGTLTTFTTNCTPPTCPKPTSITVSNIGDVSADVTWVPGGTETAWNLEYKAPTDAAWTVVPVTTTSYTLTNLTGYTTYDVRVQADCGGGDVSDYRSTSFSTQGCAAANQCTYTFNLTDAYGDGWNGGTLSVQQNGTTVATIGMSTGSSATEMVVLCDNMSTSLVWNGGSFQYEAGFSIIGPDGTQLFAHDSMDTYTTYTFTTNCGGSGPVITDPTVATNPATNVAQTTATLNGTITNPDNVTITAKGFEWKATTGGTYTPVTVTGSTLTYALDNLTANTGYTYKAFITFNGTTVYGSEVTFTTLQQGQATEPSATTAAATNVTQTTATLNGSISNPDNVTITAKGFEWKATAGGTYTPVTVTGNDLTYNLSGLTANTGYTYKAFVTTANGTHYGNEVTFTTLQQGVEPCDVPTGLDTTTVANESISITWNANASVNSWNIQYRPQNGTWASATSNTNNYTITGLTGNTTYEIQVQANCGDGNLSDWSGSLVVTTKSVGIENWLSSSVTLYPNPAKEYIDIRVDGDVNVTMMEVYDVYGKLINTVGVCDTPVQTRINVSNLANGMYFVRVTTEAGVVTKSFVKK